MVKQVKFSKLEDFIQHKKGKIILVDFWAPWCGPCYHQGDILEDLHKEQSLGKDVLIVKVNIDDDENLADRYGIEVIPTLMFFKDGERLRVQVPVDNESEYEDEDDEDEDEETDPDAGLRPEQEEQEIEWVESDRLVGVQSAEDLVRCITEIRATIS